MHTSDRPRLLYGVIAASVLFVIAVVVYMSLVPDQLPIAPPGERPAATPAAQAEEAEPPPDPVPEEDPAAGESETVFDEEAMRVIRDIQQDIDAKREIQAETEDPAPQDSEERFISNNERRLEAMVREEEEKLQALADALEYFDREALELDAMWKRLVNLCDTGWYDPKDRKDLERGWYRVWDIDMGEHEDPECRALLLEIRARADEIREGVSTALEQARRDALLPGDVRKLRARHRFSWYGLN